MIKLYHDVADRHAKGELAEKFGFTDQDRFKKLVEQTKKSMKEAGLPNKATKDLDAELDKVGDEVQAVEQLSEILHKIFKKYGKTVNLHFVYFDWGGKKHLHVQCNDKTFKTVEKMMKAAQAAEIDANKVFQALLTDWATKIATLQSK